MAVRYYQGTVVGKGPEFDKDEAAKKLRKAMKGLGTDEKAIIDVLSSHNNDELQEIKLHYKTCYGRILGEDLISELSGHFESLCLYLLLPRRHFQAYCLHRAMEGLGTDEQSLIEILCTATNYDIQEIKKAYKEKYKTELEKDLKGDTSGDFRNLLISLVQGNRSDEQTIDETLVKKDVQDLYKGTVVGKGPEFDKDEAAKKLRKAMKGLGTDEKAIIDVLSSHNNDELQEIKLHYKTCYGRILGEDLISELSGHFESLCLYLLLPRRHFQAYCLHRAMEGLGTDEQSLIEILCTATNYDIQEIKKAYKEKYKTELEKDLKGDTSGDFRNLLISLVQGNRSDEQTIDETLVKKDVQDLYKAGVNRLGTDEDVFNRILVIRSIPHLQEVFRQYASKDGQDIQAVIESEMSGDVKDAFIAVVRFIKDPVEYFAECFHKCIKGLGTNDERLMQLVVMRCEVDLCDIAESYLTKYHVGLSRAIYEDTSGDYRKLLVRLTNLPSITAQPSGYAATFGQEDHSAKEK